MATVRYVRKAWWNMPHPIHFVIGTARDELSKSRVPRIWLEVEDPSLLDKLIKLARNHSKHRSRI